MSVFGAAIGGYPNMVLMMSAHMFFNKNIVCRLSVSAFIANASNLIIKPAICFLPCQNISIFHLVSAALLLLLNTVLISSTNSFQLWVSLLSSSSSIFFCV